MCSQAAAKQKLLLMVPRLGLSLIDDSPQELLYLSAQACNRMYRSLQPYVAQPATVCGAACSRVLCGAALPLRPGAAPRARLTRATLTRAALTTYYLLLTTYY